MLSKKVTETQEKYNEAKKDSENQIALIKELEGKIFTIEKEKLLISQNVITSEEELRLTKK